MTKLAKTNFTHFLKNIGTTSPFLTSLFLIIAFYDVFWRMWFMLCSTNHSSSILSRIRSFMPYMQVFHLFWLERHRLSLLQIILSESCQDHPVMVWVGHNAFVKALVQDECPITGLGKITLDKLSIDLEEKLKHEILDDMFIRPGRSKGLILNSYLPRFATTSS